MLNIIAVVFFYVLNELLLEKVFLIRTKLHNMVKVPGKYLLVCTAICLIVCIIVDILVKSELSKYLELYVLSLLVFLLSKNKDEV